MERLDQPTAYRSPDRSRELSASSPSGTPISSLERRNPWSGPIRAKDSSAGTSIQKRPISGYSGHVHGLRSSFGYSFADCLGNTLKDGKEMEIDRTSFRKRYGGGIDGHVEQSTLGSMFTNFRKFASHMELTERYEAAIRQLRQQGHTQDMLLQMIQSKIQGRVRSYAEQAIKIRKMFEYFDMDESGDMDEYEFRQCLEMLNVQLNDVQVVALFAHLDKRATGRLSWDDFAEKIMTANPKGGTALAPKAITSSNKNA